MKVLGVWNHKGGVGKSTLTLNLAASLASGAAKHRVVVTDEDEQGSAHKAAKAGKLPFSVISGVPENPAEVDFWIVDFKAGHRQVPGMQHVLIPTTSDALDMNEFQVAVSNAMGADKSIIYVHNKYVSRQSFDAEEKRLLAKLGAIKVDLNTAFPAAAKLGSTVYDRAVKGGNPSRARGQMDLIASALWQMVPDVEMNEDAA